MHALPEEDAPGQDTGLRTSLLTARLSIASTSARNAASYSSSPKHGEPGVDWREALGGVDRLLFRAISLELETTNAGIPSKSMPPNSSGKSSSEDMKLNYVSLQRDAQPRDLASPMRHGRQRPTPSRRLQPQILCLARMDPGPVLFVVTSVFINAIVQANGPLTPENVFDYFATSMFYDKQSNNQVLRMQTVHTGMPILNEAEELK
jgi:hypothetical protein